MLYDITVIPSQHCAAFKISKSIVEISSLPCNTVDAACSNHFGSRP
ncbi:hypothetical protein AVEN_1366-1, partial [Araneus ventricosus]